MRKPKTRGIGRDDRVSRSFTVLGAPRGSGLVVSVYLLVRQVPVGKFRKLFPDIPIEPGFAWAGTFADSVDGLPYIGQHPGFPNAWFAACYGGNGILFGVAAADIIRDGCLGLPNDSARLFRLDR